MVISVIDASFILHLLNHPLLIVFGIVFEDETCVFFWVCGQVFVF